MYRHLLILPDGTELFSGKENVVAIQSVSITEQVNSQQELSVGSVCAKMIDITLISDDGSFPIAKEDKIVVYRVDSAEGRYLVGSFYVEEPTKTSAHKFRVTGFDDISKLDKDLTQWLTELSQWPYTVKVFAGMVCDRCGVSLVEAPLPNEDFYIQPFAGENITGRLLMQWMGQIAGRFCRATPEGNIEFAWYTLNDRTFISPSGQEGSSFYLQNQLTFSDYEVCPVEKVQIRQSAEDVGTVFPNVEGERNTYVIENNPMLAAQDATTLVGVAEALYSQLASVTYTPFRVKIPATPTITAGDVIKIVDIYGKELAGYVMKKTSDGRYDTLEATGSYRRDSTTAVNNLGFRALSGKVLNLRTDVDGIKAENKDTQGRLAAFSLDLEGIQTQVSRQQSETEGLRQDITAIAQNTQEVSIQVQSILDNGAEKIKTGMGYTFNDEGLNISREDSQISNRLDHTGMYVSKRGSNVLRATADGVEAVDITVKNYLIVGSHARFEDYTDGSSRNRTACFYLEGGT